MCIHISHVFVLIHTDMVTLNHLKKLLYLSYNYCVSDTGEHIRKGVSLALASGTIRQKYNTRNKTDPFESKKMPHTKGTNTLWSE